MPLSTKLTAHLFNRMIAIYGGKWSAQFQTDEVLKAAINEWAEALNRYDGAELNRGIDTARLKFPEFPPTLGQFIACCQATATEATALRRCHKCGISQEDEKRKHNLDLIGRMDAYFCWQHHPEMQVGINDLRELCKARGLPANF